MRKRAIVILTLICLCLSVFPVHANTSYSVKRVLSDGTYETLYNTASYSEANRYYETNVDDSNYAIFKEDKLVKVRYGVVVFTREKGCNYTIHYTNVSNNQQGYTNGCYGADGLYLDTNENQTKALFQLSNAVGWVPMSDVTIYPYEAFNTYSSYFVEEGHLYHQIKTNMNIEAYGATLDLGEAPSYLKENVTYFSYDGKYFYDNFHDLRDDNYAYVHTHAINPTTPHYNYYQYVSNRSLTQYREEEINHYITNILGIDSAMTSFYDKNKDSISEILNQSQYYDSASALLQYQFQYGANALMMLSISSNETASGRAGLAFFRNNLFGHAAYDSNVEANASRYNSVASSIASHAKVYISNNYSNPKKFMYHGSFFGDKGSGMNVSYASDPYWGEKAAQYYMRMDSQLGGKDKNAYALGIKSTSSNIPIYSLPSEYSTPLYYTGSNWDYAFILLEKLYRNGTNWYKVQADPAMDELRETSGVYYYDFSEMVGYIRESDVQYVLNEDKVINPSYTTSIYDAGGGRFSDGSIIQKITHLASSPLNIVPPVMENAIFQGFERSNAEDTSHDNYYQATYKMVDHAWIEGDYQTTYAVGETLNLSNMKLTVLYEDGSKQSIPVTTSMVSAVSFAKEGAKEFTVRYQGIEAQAAVLVIQGDSTLANLVASKFNDFYALHPLGTPLTIEDMDTLSSIIQDSQRYGVIFSYDEIRYVDEMLKEAYAPKLQVKIEKNPYDLNFSGLSYLLPLSHLTNNRLPSTLHVNTKPLDEELYTKFKTIVEGNGWHFYDAFDLEMKLNKEIIDLDTNYIISIAKPKGHDLSQSYILLAEENGNIYRIFGKQSDSRILFQTQGFTKFAICYQNTNNVYSDMDVLESYRMDNNGYDVSTRFLMIGGISIALLIALMLLIYTYLHTPKKPQKETVKALAKREEPLRISNVPLQSEKDKKNLDD